MLSACSKLSKLKESSRHPVIFILDPRIQSLPWESLPCLTSCKQPASRVPSLSFLHTIISGACFLSKEELEASISKVLDSSNISPAMLSACSKLSKLKESSRHPVIFILDPRIQSLPWESLPCLASCRQPAS